MKQILILGAGKSSPSLIRYLLERAEENDWRVTVGDLDPDVAKERVAGFDRGEGIPFDVGDAEALERLVSKSDVVVNFLAPKFQAVVAEICVNHGVHMVSASYRSPDTLNLDAAARDKGVTILCEMGLDPGIDLMSAMKIIREVRARGGVVRKFISYGSGLPAIVDGVPNPMGYAITWNPYNVVLAGGSGAQFLRDGQVKILPHNQMFYNTWPFEVDDVGLLEAYANRDSIGYKELFGMAQADTMIRATLRYPGYSEVWARVIDLGLTDDNMPIPDLSSRSMADIVEMHLPDRDPNTPLRERVARHLDINATGKVMEMLEWMGLFDTTVRGFKGSTTADAMVQLVGEKFTMPPKGRDMVILVHDLEVEYEKENGRRERIVSTFIEYGDPQGETAMAKTVGIPAAIAVKRILSGEVDQRGALIPLEPAIYEPILAELQELGMSFRERTEAVE